MAERKTHEWYLDGKDRMLCRHCGMRATSKSIEDVNNQKCIWPNSYLKGDNKMNKVFDAEVTIKFRITKVIDQNILDKEYEGGEDAMRKHIEGVYNKGYLMSMFDEDTMEIVSVKQVETES